jgi:mono/diheme cytochrome c family protein
MRGVGGDVGPALDREGSLSSLFTTAQLRDYVRHEESRFPQSKMPPFSTLLSPAQIDQVVAYLQAMQPAK